MSAADALFMGWVWHGDDALDETRQCTQCQATRPTSGSGYWTGPWYCSNVCMHAAGDRSSCYGWGCGCSNYAKKRRLLREHRRDMRITEDLLDLHWLKDDHHDLLIATTGNAGFDLDMDRYLDEESDAPDPEKELQEEVKRLRGEKEDMQNFLAAAQAMSDAHKVKVDLERARMQLEDMRSECLR
jgi:hypothetical protein